MTPGNPGNAPAVASCRPACTVTATSPSDMEAPSSKSHDSVTAVARASLSSMATPSPLLMEGMSDSLSLAVGSPNACAATPKSKVWKTHNINK